MPQVQCHLNSRSWSQHLWLLLCHPVGEVYGKQGVCLWCTFLLWRDRISWKLLHLLLCCPFLLIKGWLKFSSLLIWVLTGTPFINPKLNLILALAFGGFSPLPPEAVGSILGQLWLSLLSASWWLQWEGFLSGICSAESRAPVGVRGSYMAL